MSTNKHPVHDAHGKKHHRRKRARRRVLPVAVALVTAVALLAILGISMLFGGRDVPAMTLADGDFDEVPVITLAPEAEPVVETVPEATPLITVAPTAEPTEVPTPEPTAEPVAFDYLPVFAKADTEAKKIAITVDDCYQVENLRAIVKTAHDNGGKLTLFPVGENISKPGMQEILRNSVFQLGFEIENHTWSHSRVFRMEESEMAAEIWKQRQAVCVALGADYQQHFFRLMGGDGASDQRTHNYLKQLGYKGIAEWSLSGSDADLDWIKRDLSPGMIYLFHTTDADTAKLKEFIPYVKSQGYQMVTMNELLGFEDNAVSELTVTDMPAPQAFTVDYHIHKKGDYAWIIVQMQDKLREMGLLEMDGPSTGYYGDQTAAAISAYQASQGLTPTGEADAETQKRLLGVTA